MYPLIISFQATAHYTGRQAIIFVLLPEKHKRLASAFAESRSRKIPKNKAKDLDLVNKAILCATNEKLSDPGNVEGDKIVNSHLFQIHHTD